MPAPAQPKAPPSSSGIRGHHRHAAVWFALVAGLLALLLYAATGSRGVEWQDSGIHQYRIITGQLEHPLGLALSHPLHYWLGRAALRVPWGAAPWRLNLLSAFCGAVGVGVLTGLVLRLTRRWPAAVLAACALAFAHAYWQMSALTETYTLAAALMVIEWALLLRYVRTQTPVWLVAVFAVNGLHVADHLLGLLTLATYGVLLLERVARRRIAPAWLPAALAAWLIAASPYWTLVLDHWQRTDDAAGTLSSALFGGGGGAPGWRQQVLNVTVSAAQLKFAFLTLGYCFPSLTGLLAVAGLLRRAPGRRRVFRRVLLAQTAIVFLFVGRYAIKDVYTYFVPVCALVALWCGLGTASLLRRRRRAAARRGLAALLVVNALLPLAVYYCFPLVAKQRGWLRGQMRSVPYRDEYMHFFRPWRFSDHSAALFSEAALTAAGPGGWILADSTTVFPIAVTQLTDQRFPDLRVYWTNRQCVYPLHGPPLTELALFAHAQRGGAVIAVPSPEVQRLVPEPLVLDKSGPFWYVRHPGDQ